MNGSSYKLPRFTLPASNNATQISWDLAMLDKFEFRKRYDITGKMYERIAAGETLEEVRASYRRV